MLSFSRDPKGYIQDLLRSQSRDLKVKGNLGERWVETSMGDSECRAGVSRLRMTLLSSLSQVMTDVGGNPEEEPG